MRSRRDYSVDKDAWREQIARDIEAYNSTMQLGDDVFQDEGTTDECWRCPHPFDEHDTPTYSR
jgi:hypothetical protein